MNLKLEVQSTVASPGVPSEADFRPWVEAALRGGRERAELVIRIVGVAEMTRLNETYRKRTGPTNVLSFPFRAPAPVVSELLGDLVICAPVVEEEAAAQGKTGPAHWAHMTVHGTLHLLGFEHRNDRDAGLMEELETEILAALGFPDPYLAPREP